MWLTRRKTERAKKALPWMTQRRLWTDFLGSSVALLTQPERPFLTSRGKPVLTGPRLGRRAQLRQFLNARFREPRDKVRSHFLALANWAAAANRWRDFQQ